MRSFFAEMTVSVVFPRARNGAFKGEGNKLNQCIYTSISVYLGSDIRYKAVDTLHKSTVIYSHHSA